MSEITSVKPETIVVTVAIEMKHAVVHLAGARRDYDTRESMIARAARKAGITFRQAKSFYYGETHDPRSSAVERVRAAVGRQTVGAQNELIAIAADFNALAERITRVDPEMAGPHADAFRDIARRARRLADGGE